MRSAQHRTRRRDQSYSATMPAPGQPVANLSILSDRGCLITFAAMVLNCDPSVREHEMGYPIGNGVSFITATGAAKRTGLPVADSEHALQRLEAAGLAVSNPLGQGWRLDTNALAALSG